MLKRLYLGLPVLLVFSTSSPAQTLDQKIDAAKSIIASRMATIKQEQQNIAELKAESEERLIPEEDEEEVANEPVLFSVQRTSLDWQLGALYKSHQDYRIELDFSNEKHTEQLDEQYTEWINKGWFIESSKIKYESTNSENHATVYVRLVKMK